MDEMQHRSGESRDLNLYFSLNFMLIGAAHVVSSYEGKR